MPSTVVRRVLFTPPALLINTSRRSCVARYSSASRRTAACDEKSHIISETFGDPLRSCTSARPPRCGAGHGPPSRRARPGARDRSDAYRPIPLVAPVTSTVFPRISQDMLNRVLPVFYGRAALASIISAGPRGAMPSITSATITAFYLFDVAEQIDLALLHRPIGGGATNARLTTKTFCALVPAVFRRRRWSSTASRSTCTRSMAFARGSSSSTTASSRSR